MKAINDRQALAASIPAKKTKLRECSGKKGVYVVGGGGNFVLRRLLLLSGSEKRSLKGKVWSVWCHFIFLWYFFHPKEVFSYRNPVSPCLHGNTCFNIAFSLGSGPNSISLVVLVAVQKGARVRQLGYSAIHSA